MGKTFTDELASHVYYVLSITPECGSDYVNVNGFTRKNRADQFIEKTPGSILVRHSKLALSRLDMRMLMRIVRTSQRSDLAHATNVTQMKRDDLVDFAHSHLWGACLNSGKLEGDPHRLTYQEERAMAKAAAAEAEGGTKVKDMRGKKGAKAEGAEAKEPKPKREPKPDEYAGKRISLVGKDNPRREGTHGHRSMEVVRNKPGITYEDYIAAGGRRVDLKGSIELKQVELK